MLSYEELEAIIEKITSKVILANREETLDNLLIQWGLDEFISKAPIYDTYKDGKIVVIGESEIKENILNGIIKSLGIDKSRFEFCLDYNKAKTFQYKKLRHNPNYRLVLFGPVPHSSSGKNDSSSVIAEMQNHDGYPKIVVLKGNNAIKITKSNFKTALQKMLDENYI